MMIKVREWAQKGECDTRRATSTRVRVLLNDANILELPERKVIANMVIIDKPETLAARMDNGRFSKFQRLLNTPTRILNLYDRFKKCRVEEKTEYSLMELNPNVLDRAEKLWVMEAQEQRVYKVKNGKFDRLCPQIFCGIIYIGGAHLQS